MKKFSKLSGFLVGGVLVLVLVLANAVFVSATPPAPTAPDPTTCADCQAEQDAIDAAYVDLEAVVDDLATLSGELETMLEALDPAVAADQLDLITDGQQCENEGNSFRYYSSFEYDGSLYCFRDETEYNDFFTSVIADDPANAADWTNLKNSILDLLTDADSDPDDVEDLLALIDTLMTDLADCEAVSCPVAVTCPDCEAIAADLQTAMDDLSALEDDADLLDAEVLDLEAQLDDVYQQFEELQLLQDEFTQMVEDANGMTGADCDNFQLEAGQTWGITHNFSNVQWCFNSDPNVKMEDFVSDLQDYWQNDSSVHLPADATLSDQLDTLMNDYIAKLDEYQAVLDDLDNATDDVNQLSQNLDGCLTDLAASTDPGTCATLDVPAMEALVDDADAMLSEGYLPPGTPTPTPEEPFPDTIGHWAETYIQELKDAGVVSGDGDTGLFRPDDPLNRAEAAKIVPLAKGDTIGLCNPAYYPDVAVLDWFCEFVTTSTDQGYFEGYPDGTFQPANLILRAEAVAVVMRATGFPIPNYTSYSLPDIVGDEWYADYAEKAYQCGVIEGRLAGTQHVFAGPENITRAEFAKIVNLTIFHDLQESDCADYVP